MLKIKERFPNRYKPCEISKEIKLKEFKQKVQKAIEAIRADEKELLINFEALGEIVDRVEKRKVYFWVFYGIEEMSEMHEAALHCYWILKFAPFHYEGRHNININVRIATYLFMNMIMHTLSLKGARLQTQIDDEGQDFVDKITYAFAYRDISMEAIMLIAESLLSSAKRD